MGKRADGYVCWAQAVELGGMGHTARALTILTDVGRRARGADDGVLVSLAGSTRASLLRQAGRHRAAAGIDGAALSAVLSGQGDAELPGAAEWHRAAVLDAVVGLAADHLGRLHLAAAGRLLDRARAVVAPDEGRADEGRADEGWLGGRRPRLRIAWVSAELAMYAGDPARATEHAREASELAAVDGTPERHRVKTMLIAAAAAATAGDPARANGLATEVTRRARDAALLPLEWASLALRQGIDPADAQVAGDLSRTRAGLIRRGVPFEP
ncbi:hypothetical protein [Gordonia insulae]|uniref:Uncharacterized protein n=1 Tax=Gordonia insulae TaxID=2420509 RepID=A0A3G8JIW4_9ACTN|nr:hypothetical protein [Gordonia insulae]AZG44943.1 hypothetical protein D7316_01535 [Gordonia insulae]